MDLRLNQSSVCRELVVSSCNILSAPRIAQTRLSQVRFDRKTAHVCVNWQVSQECNSTIGCTTSVPAPVLCHCLSFSICPFRLSFAWFFGLGLVSCPSLHFPSIAFLLNSCCFKYFLNSSLFCQSATVWQTMTMTMTHSEKIPIISQKPGTTDMSDGVMTP